MTTAAQPMELPPSQRAVPAPIRPGVNGGRAVKATDIAFVVNLVICAGLILGHAPWQLRAPFLLVGLLTCPGYACLRLAGFGLSADTPALTIATSLSITTVLSAAEALSRFWHPTASSLAVAAAAVVGIAVARLRPRPPVMLQRSVDASADGSADDSAHDSSNTSENVDNVARSEAASAWPPPPPSLLRYALIALAPVCVVVWAVGLRHVDLAYLSPWGLLPRLSIAWYIGVALATLGCAMTQRLSGRTHVVLSATYLAILVLYLYGTAPAIETTLRYVWTFKHLSVIQNVIASKGVHRTDIYQRWPGLFATTAVYSILTGHVDPTPYLRWGEPFFTVLNLVMLYPLARRFTTSRGAWFACYFFAATNWVGQEYFSPQAFGFMLTLACLLLATSLLAGTMKLRPQRAVARWLRLPTEVPARVQAAALRPVTATWRLVLPALFVVDAAIVVSHQLTPYMVLFDLGALVVVGLLRPWWAVGVFIVLTAGFLAPNLAYIQHTFGLLSALDPFKNALTEPGGTTARSVAVRDQAHLSILFTLLTWLTGVVGIAWHYRRRDQRRSALTMGLLFVAPFLTLFVQSYGGEARFRVLLFTLPACAVAAAWLWERSRGTGRWRRAVASFALLPVPVALFVPNFFGKENIYYVPPGEVAAASWVQTHADHQVVTVADPEFPGLQTYDNNLAGASSTTVLLTSYYYTTSRPTMSPAQSAARDMREASTLGASSGYLIFATTEAAYGVNFEAFGGPDGYHQLEQSVASSRLFRVVYSNSDATIYQLRPYVA